MSSQTKGNRELRKKFGCMNGVFQIFDRQHLLTSRRMNNRHNQKLLLLQGGQQQFDPKYSQKALTEKEQSRQKDTPRISSDSSLTSYSSSCSSTFSSLDYIRSAQSEAMTERTPPLSEGIRYLDDRDAGKLSKNGDVGGLTVNSSAYDEKKRMSIKHIDSPRPALSFQHVIKPKAIGYERSDRPSVKVQENAKVSNDERVMLPPRFSYDELREKIKSNMIHREPPRRSLDSNVSSSNFSGIKSKLDVLGHNLHTESTKNVGHNDSVKGTHIRSPSIVTKLMGLGVFAEATAPVDGSSPTVRSYYKEAFLSRITSRTEERKQHQEVTCSPRVSQNDATTVSRKLGDANSRKKSTSAVQGTQNLALNNARANFPEQPSSVYGDIEKRITKLEFRKSGKNLRALKHVLESIHRTRDSGESTLQLSRSEGNCSDQNSNTCAWKDSKSLQKQLGPSTTSMKATRAADNINSFISNGISTSEVLYSQQIETRDTKSPRASVSSNVAPENNKRGSEHPPSYKKKPNRRSSESDMTFAISHHTKEAKHFTPDKKPRTVRPRLKPNQLWGEEQSRTPPSGLNWAKKHPHTKFIEASHLKDGQLSEISRDTNFSGYQGDTASAKSERNNSIVSQTESETISSASSSNIRVKQKGDLKSLGEQKQSAKISRTTHEQPSPISVLDATSYAEDMSPVKKTPRSFREDESPSSGEAEWHYKDKSSLNNCTRFDTGYVCKLQLQHSVIQQNHSNGETVGSQKSQLYETINSDHRYVYKILMALGAVKESSFIPTADHVLSSCHLINPEMFHVLEQTEDIGDAPSGQLQERTRRGMLKEKVHRKIIFDMVNEILVDYIHSGRLVTVGKRIKGMQDLLKEVYMEIDRICKIPESNCSDAEDEATRLLTVDMMHKSKDWLGYNSEVPVLILDIERLIFKDLISEVVLGEIPALHDRGMKNCRQLFSK